MMNYKNIEFGGEDECFVTMTFGVVEYFNNSMIDKKSKKTFYSY